MNQVIHNPPEKAEKRSISLPAVVYALAKERRKDEGYGSLSAYLAGLVIFDAYARRKHWLTAELMREPVEVRDKVFAEIYAAYIAKAEHGSSWFEHRIEEIVANKT